MSPWVERHFGLLFIGGLCLVSIPITWLMFTIKDRDFVATGQLVARGTQWGDFTMDGVACSLEGRKDPGVNLVSESGAAILVQGRGVSQVVVVDVPSTCQAEGAACEKLHLSAATCAKFSVVLEETNMTFNKARVWRGLVLLSCALEKGTVEMDLRFGQCV